jgi:mannose-6-phosphate isomerase-like protein (cupin superfamily)
MDAPLLLGPGEGETLRPGFEIKAGRPELVLTESLYQAGQRGPDPHVHRHHVDSFWVLEGELLLGIGPDLEPRSVAAGGFALVPPEVLHTFHNPGPAEARFLNLHAPGLGFEEYLRSGFTAPFDQHYMPAGTGLPAAEVILHQPGEGERLEFGPSAATLKAGASDALGSFALTDFTIAPGFPGPVPHRHERMVDSFYVLEGVLTLRIGDEEIAAPAGSYGVVPPGNTHTFSNPGPDPVRVLNLMAPGGLEGYLRELAQLGGPPDPAVMAQLASKYDFVEASRGLAPPDPR